MSSEADDPLARQLDLGSSSTARRCLILFFVLPCLPLLLAVSALVLPPLLVLFASYSLLFRPELLRGLPRDLSFVVRLVRATLHLKRRISRSQGGFTAADYWAETVSAHHQREALIFEGRSWTYAQVDLESNLSAQWALAEGLGVGESVALMCANRPEHLFLWLGMAKAGVATTLVNTALRGTSLEHAFSQCEVKRVLFDVASAAALAHVAPVPAAPPPPPQQQGQQREALSMFVCIDAYALGEGGAPAFARALELPDAASLPPDLPRVLKLRRAGCRATDTLMHIFTSGTTGLPKAARLNHLRFFSAIVIPYMFDLRESDRVYCCLPLCHTAAIGSLSICWWLGAPLILAPKFSASKFWKDCVENRATVIQYVGELCRYLVSAPRSPYDQAHSVRIAFGNGLRPEVWPRFVKRFAITRVAEVYASTEGNANLANTVGKEGAVGFISPLLSRMYPVRLVRLKEGEAGSGHGDYGDLQRSPSTGLCVLCQPGEVGELLGLVDQRDPARNFAGYTDTAATRGRVVRDVLKRGDCWFRTGDTMRCDADGFVYFADRMGDTFRYKGENVSTAEVAAVIGGLEAVGDEPAALRTAPCAVRHCLVYGVRLPHVDGRVGMAALLLEPDVPSISMAAVFEQLDKQLPSYAHPRFLRLLNSATAIQYTHTFKPKVTPLQAEGINPSESGSVYMRNAAERTYAVLDPETHRKIVEEGLAPYE